MNIDYLIQLLTNRLTGLALAKDQAFSSGDLERINAVDAEILDIHDTLSKLRLVSNVEQAATVSSLTASQIVQRGIESIFTPSVINGSTEVLLKYNIAPYATDPYHETKIQNILENMGFMNNADNIEIYLRKKVPDSPLNGLMVFDSSIKYDVDARLMMAIMELDSRYGTQGVGARTFNPGNVGNTGLEERMYSSWQDGVDAVARWLNNHRIINNEEKITLNMEPVINNTDTTPQYTVTPVIETTSIVAPVATTTVAITPETASGVTSYATTSVAVSTSIDTISSTSTDNTITSENVSTSSDQSTTTTTE